MDIQVNDVSKIYGTGENKVVALTLSRSWGRLVAVKARCFTS